jgi:succinylglutamate desuccinylase
MGPGWNLFHPPGTRRKKRVEDVEQDLVRAFEDATGITAERERLEAIRELKRAAATALSIAKAENDAELEARAQQIVALKKQRLQAEAYLSRVGEILGQLQAQDDDDMEALELIARMI